MSDLKKFNEDRKVRISHEFLDKYRTGKLGIHAQKLLFGLAQCLDLAEDLFPDWDIDIRGLFDYLNLSEDNNDRYEIVRNAIRELAKNPLEYKISDKHWGLINWLSYAKFDESNSMFVRLRFTDDCKPFLLNYKQYCEMQTKYYVGLTSANAMWLYPHLRNAYKKKGGIHTITIQHLQEITYTDSLAAYDINKNSSANKDS